MHDISLTDQSPRAFFYTTAVSLGTPPQSIPAIIDTAWGDLFAPSINCAGSHRCADKIKFNSSASSSFHKVDGAEELTTVYGPVFAYGKEAAETLTIGSLSVPKQHFHDLTYYEEVFPDDDLAGWDSVLGLAWERPTWMDDPRLPNTLQSPFKTIVESEVLDRNVFSLKLPRNLSDDGGIVFGGWDEELIDKDELVYHPLYPEDTTLWQVKVTGVSFTSGQGHSNLQETVAATSDKSYSALLLTTYPILALPAALGDDLLSQLPLEKSSCGMEMVIPCSKVSDLPDLVINFEEGGDFVLKGRDYVAEMTLSWCDEPVVECLPLIDSLPESLPGVEDPSSFILLGSEILKTVYSVFDWDEKRVGCEYFWLFSRSYDVLTELSWEAQMRRWNGTIGISCDDLRKIIN